MGRLKTEKDPARSKMHETAFGCDVNIATEGGFIVDLTKDCTELNKREAKIFRDVHDKISASLITYRTTEPHNLLLEYSLRLLALSSCGHTLND
jgi:hypothetical protein